MFIFVIIFQGRMTQELLPRAIAADQHGGNHHRRIAEEPPRGFVDIFGINSEKVIVFLELIPKKLYICSWQVLGDMSRKRRIVSCL